MIDYRIRVGPLPMRWRTEIPHWEPPSRFVDVQSRGPYSLWWHEHRFTAIDGSVIMDDRVYYALPLGPLGRLVHRFIVGPMLRRIFAYRRRAIERRFGSATPASAGPRTAAG